LIAGKGIQGIAQIVDVPAKIVKASAGYHHVLMTSDTGKVWCWGENNYGQLGSQLPLFVAKPEPMKDVADKQCLALSCGYFHCLYVIT
jgi:alpha-tubulin suppressor-like RCC1 family protein